MSFLFSIPVWGWFDISFNIAVLVALCGESHWALKWLIPNSSKGKTSVKWRREKLKKKFEFLLILGIAGEVGCLPFSLYESASSNLEAKGAEQRAGKSYELAENIARTNAELTATNLMLRINIIELEARQLRNVTPQMRDKFVKELSIFPKKVKCPVRVFLTADDIETRTYAYQIRELLDDAGYKWNDTNGVMNVPTEIYPFSIDAPYRNVQMTFIFNCGTNSEIVLPSFYFNFRGLEGKQIISRYGTNDASGAPGMLFTAFEQIGISAAFAPSASFMFSELSP